MTRKVSKERGVFKDTTKIAKCCEVNAQVSKYYGICFLLKALRIKEN
jgi:hypothetical protein